MMAHKQLASHGSVPTLRLEIPPDPRFARTVRDALTGFAKLHGVAQDELDSLIFAVGEALANAIEHAASEADVEVLCEVDNKRITATIIDSGCGITTIPAKHTPLPDGLDERGRGIPIMQRCTDFFHIRSVPGRGTAITLGLTRRATAH